MLFLSTEADWQTVPLSASPRVAVILRVRVRVTAVDQHGVVDQRRVVEALGVELGCSLRFGLQSQKRKKGRKRERE